MNIDDYDFGTITIDGEVYEKDLIVYPDRVEEDWRRQEGHELHEEDIEGVLETDPDYFVMGIGYSGRVDISQPVRNLLRKKGIKLEDHKTGPATIRYNQLAGDGEDVVGAFHLTC